MVLPIKHVSVKVIDLDQARTFYEEVLGYRHVRTAHTTGLEGDYISCHMTDGNVDLALEYFGESPDPGAALEGAPCIDHFGMEVDDIEAFIRKIEAWGGKVLIRHSATRVKFTVPDLPTMEVVQAGRWSKPIAALKMD
ncbi:MAG TPA: VOC family protein [Burkholderiaceae bacterium]|nr:VOC family protein [Burkholderiaceae bacterium]